MDWGLAGLGGLGAGLFGSQNYHNPADEAAKFYKQVPGTIKPYYQPYIDQGRSVMPGLNNMYGQLTSNPGAFLNNLSQGYQQSPGYQFNLQQALGAANNAAAAGGMAGSLQHQQQAAGIASGLASQDYGNWLNHVLGLYDRGLSGQQGIEEQGYGASTDLGKNLAQALIGQGNLSYLGQENENTYHQNQIKDLLSLLSTAAGFAGG